jgi:hypothetical protein
VVDELDLHGHGRRGHSYPTTWYVSQLCRAEKQTPSPGKQAGTGKQRWGGGDNGRSKPGRPCRSKGHTHNYSSVINDQV